MKTILSSWRHHYVKRVSIFLIAVALIAGMVSCVPPPLEIRDWYDLDAVRNNLGGSYILMNNFDSTTTGYEDLASPTANQGKGWQPIGNDANPFTGTFDGQGHEISDLFINRSDENDVGLFGYVDGGRGIQNVGVLNANVTGEGWVGGLVGKNEGTVSNSYSTGNVTGQRCVGGLVGGNSYGSVSSSYSSANVTGTYQLVGGLVGGNYRATVRNSYSTGNVTGEGWVGGLVGGNTGGTVSKSYSTGNVTGTYQCVGGLVGENMGGTVSKSYSTGNVTGNLRVGGLVGVNYDGGTVSKSYSTGNVTGNSSVGGLVGYNDGSIVSNSFWDTETSGQDISAGGEGKTTAEMQDITTFSGAGWDIVAVASPSTRILARIWNIVKDETYPFLSWQP